MKRETVESFKDKYIGIELLNGWFFKGFIKNIDEESVTLVSQEKSIAINLSNIKMIREIDKNGNGK